MTKYKDSPDPLARAVMDMAMDGTIHSISKELLEEFVIKLSSTVLYGSSRSTPRPVGTALS